MLSAFFVGLMIFGWSAAYAGTENSSTDALVVETREQESWSSSLKPIVGFRSYNDSGRYGPMDKDQAARVYKSQNEVFLGAKTPSNWGGYVMSSQILSNFNDTRKNNWSAGDASATFLHPAWFEGDHFRVTGAYRQYFPTSDYSNRHTIYQSAYYIGLIADSGRWDFFNILIPRYFSKGDMQATDTTLYFEDRATVSQKIKNWLRVGAGQWSQVEYHHGSPTGNCIEVYPYIDFVINKTTYISGRFSFPIYAQGAVYDGPAFAKRDFGYTELFFETTL